ncbi:MAG TPA: hypothetical protein V6C81_03745 [Planktothrix sp.]|jgi:hypothetical protein
MQFCRTFAAALMWLFVIAILTIPSANAQATGNEYTSSGSTGVFGNDSKLDTGTQTRQLGAAAAPQLQGATNGTIGPQGTNATYVTGLNTAGTVRVNNLANLEALLNIMANGFEILGIAWGGPTLMLGCFYLSSGSQEASKRIMGGVAGVVGGLATPGVINWLVASARDANLFN